MSKYQLSLIQRIFIQCFKDLVIWERFQSDGQYFESNDIDKEGRRWLVIAAGIDNTEASELFSGLPKRMEKSTIPLSYKDTCSLSLLFVLRPFDGDLNALTKGIMVAPFAPKRGVPWVEISKSYLRISDLPTNDSQLFSLRWELDITASFSVSLEPWLRNWEDDCGFNPAHPPSHLHINSPGLITNEKDSQRPVDTENELRLAIGMLS